MIKASLNGFISMEEKVQLCDKSGLSLDQIPLILSALVFPSSSWKHVS